MSSELIGFLGNLFFAICGIPQCLRVYNGEKLNKRFPYKCTNPTADLSVLFILGQIGGNVFCAMFMYSAYLETGKFMWQQFMNYGVALVCMGYLLYKKVHYTDFLSYIDRPFPRLSFFLTLISCRKFLSDLICRPERNSK